MILYKNKHKLHDTLVTSKLFLWNKTKEGYIDNITGLLWYKIESHDYTYNYAMKQFNSETKRLPTKLEWEEAEKHGIREIYNDLKWFWSSSVHPGYSYSDYVFDGRVGDIVTIFSRLRLLYSVRCVAAR